MRVERPAACFPVLTQTLKPVLRFPLEFRADFTVAGLKVTLPEGGG
jgi:hypothetical protein